MNQSAFRLVWIMLTAVILTLGVIGCMGKKQENQEAGGQASANQPAPEVIKERVLAHLQEKYGEEFVPVSFNGSGWAYPYNQMILYPKNGSSSDRFEARIVINKDGTYDISDGYFGVWIAPEYSKTVSGIVKEFYKDFKFSLHFGDGVFPERLNKTTSIEEIYNKEEYFNADVVVFVKEESAEGMDANDTLRKIADRMIEKKLVGDVTVYVVKNEKFDSITTEALDTADSSEYFLGEEKTVMIGNDLSISALE